MEVDLQCLAIKQSFTNNLFQILETLDYLGYDNALIFINVIFSSLYQDLVSRTLIDNNVVLEASHDLTFSVYKVLSTANFTTDEITLSKIFRKLKNQVIIKVHVSTE